MEAHRLVKQSNQGIYFIVLDIVDIRKRIGEKTPTVLYCTRVRIRNPFLCHSEE